MGQLCLTVNLHSMCRAAVLCRGVVLGSLCRKPEGMRKFTKPLVLHDVSTTVCDADLINRMAAPVIFTSLGSVSSDGSASCTKKHCEQHVSPLREGLEYYQSGMEIQCRARTVVLYLIVECFPPTRLWLPGRLSSSPRKHLSSAALRYIGK